MNVAGKLLNLRVLVFFFIASSNMRWTIYIFKFMIFPLWIASSGVYYKSDIPIIA